MTGLFLASNELSTLPQRLCNREELLMRAQTIRWELILTVLPVGVVFAVATIFGWIHGLERGVALGLLLVCAVAVARGKAPRPFVHGFVAGFLVAEIAILLQALFLETYFRHNPGYREIAIPLGLDARLATFILSPVNALLAGLIVGALVWGLDRFVFRRRLT